MTPRSKKSAGLVLVILGVVGFFAANVVKSDTAVLEKRITRSGATHLDLPVEKGQRYTVFVWARDEETGFAPASLDASYRIVDARSAKVLSEKVLTASAHSSDETGGIKRAQQGGQYIGGAQDNGHWKVDIELTRGDEVTVDVYRNLPDWLNMGPGLSILVALLGGVFLIKARAASS